MLGTSKNIGHTFNISAALKSVTFFLEWKGPVSAYSLAQRSCHLRCCAVWKSLALLGQTHVIQWWQVCARSPGPLGRWPLEFLEACKELGSQDKMLCFLCWCLAMRRSTVLFLRALLASGFAASELERSAVTRSRPRCCRM